MDRKNEGKDGEKNEGKDGEKKGGDDVLKKERNMDRRKYGKIERWTY